MLCALAVASKLSAVWAPIAIVVWLLRRDRRAAATYLGALGGGPLLAFGAFEALSRGRLSDNLIGLTLTTPGRIGELADQVGRLRLIASEGLGLLALVLVLGRRDDRRDPRAATTLAELAFGAACLVTGIVLLDPGTFVNHLVDVQVLALPLVGLVWREADETSARGLLVRCAVVLACVGGLHFGSSVVEAIEARYRPTLNADGYWLYEPR